MNDLTDLHTDLTVIKIFLFIVICELSALLAVVIGNGSV